MRFDEWTLRLPEWVEGALPPPEQAVAGDEERMRLVIDLSRRNVAHGTGGPFGAGVFDGRTGRLIAPGVNLVVASRCSLAHAEMVAIALAGRALGGYDLAAGGGGCELVASTEPCAMCLGAIAWSGLRQVVCGARDEDARAVGFDEGDKPTDWVGALRARGIVVRRDVLRDQAADVLRRYAAGGGEIYNPRPQH